MHIVRVVSGSGARKVETISLAGLQERCDPPPIGWSASGWRKERHPSLSLAVSDKAIEVRGFAVSRPVLSPAETVMWTTSIGEYFGPLRVPWLKPREWLALSYTLTDGAEYTIAIRPDEDDFDRLRAALRAAGVKES